MPRAQKSAGLGLFAALLCLAVCATSAQAHGTGASAVPAPASVANAALTGLGPIEVAEAFNRALAAGDADTVQQLLVPNVLIYESGGLESSAEEYAGHHLPADMAFMAHMKRQLVSQRSAVNERSAWVASRSRLTGTYKDKALDLDSTETVVMQRVDGAWRIAHVHWSSGTHRDPAH